MRFELCLSALPDLTAEEAKDKLAGLPKGLIAGVIVKALQERRLPSVAVAWSEDKRVINEISDRLSAMGAECYVVDHAFFPLRIVTLIAERIAGDRYRKAALEDRSLIRVGGHETTARSSIFAEHVLRFGLQLLLVEALFAWRLALYVGWDQLLAAKWLWSQLIACGCGVLAGYVFTTFAHGYRTKALSLQVAAAPMFLSLCSVVAALFFLRSDREAESARQALKRPPSNPYAGLLVELARRSAAGELPQVEEPTAVASSKAAVEPAVGELMCVDSDDDQGLLECMGGPAWEQALACLPLPKLPKPSEVPRPITVAASKVHTVVSAPVQVRRRKVLRPWGVRLELLHLSSLVLVWMLSLVALHFVLTRRKQPTSPALEVEDAATQARAEPTPAKASVDLALVHALQSELIETRASLDVHRNAVAQARAQIGPIKERQAAQEAEIIRLRQLLAQVQAEAPAGQAAQRAPTPGTMQGAPAPANQQARPAGAAGVQARQDATGRMSSAYSAAAGQEERISIPKRKT